MRPFSERSRNRGVRLSRRRALYPTSAEKNLDAASAQGARPAPRLQELPPNVRDSIPNLHVSMLIYSGKAENRWININGSKQREGQEVAPGLKLEQITPSGAVFSYRGQRFYKGVIGD
jgi:general secretion pathway protein B